MNYFDFHCDTPYQIQEKKASLLKNNCHIDLTRTSAFGKYGQVAAICASPRKTDAQAYAHYIKVRDYYFEQLKENTDRAKLVTSGEEFNKAVGEGKAALFFAVEDARILDGDLSRLEGLYRDGVRFLTLVWGKTSCIGGAHNTDVGLTEFGRQVIYECFRLGIIPDISHASEQTAEETTAIALSEKKPVIATHSNSYSVYSHTRNLRDRHFAIIRDLGGIVGISLCRSHLVDGDIKSADIDSVLSHIEYYLSLGGENTLCFGCDFDGTDLPDGISSVSDMEKIADRMARAGYSDTLIGKIFWQNGADFVSRIK